MSVFDWFKPKKKEKEEPVKIYTTRIFCMGKDSSESIAGHLKTFSPIEIGHVHVIKNRRWICYYSGENYQGEKLAQFKPYDKPGFVFNTEKN